MDKKNLFTSTMLLIALFILFLGCKSPTDPTNVFENETNLQTNRFPEVFLETGHDSNYSYMSLQTIRQKDTSLKIIITGWGFESWGLYLFKQIDNRILTLNIVGRCATISSGLRKKIFEYILKPEIEDTLEQICYERPSGSLIVEKKYSSLQINRLCPIRMFGDASNIVISTDWAIIKQASILFDTLFLKVEYSGGCKKHKFKLYGYKYFLKSYPVQADIYLSHNAQNDPCRALITETLKFNLAPLKNNYINTYGRKDPILLRIHEPGKQEPLLPLVRYEFCYTTTEPNNDLSVRTDRVSYSSNQVISISLHNGTKSTAFFGHCNYRLGFYIEQKSNNNWLEKSNAAVLCLAIYPSGVKALESGQSNTDTIRINKVGLYRIKYQFGWQQSNAQTDSLLSNEFTVQ